MMMWFKKFWPRGFVDPCKRGEGKYLVWSIIDKRFRVFRVIDDGVHLVVDLPKNKYQSYVGAKKCYWILKIGR